MTAINRAGIMVSRVKDLPYGVQIFCEGQGVDGLINCFYSRKNGITVVDCTKNPTTAAVTGILRRELGIDAARAPEISERERQLKVWIGTDESGKGDFFGPLVVAGFLMNRAIEPEVLSLGVTDSKKLRSPQIRRIAAELHKRYSGHISVVSPSMDRYNSLYAQFGNLNRFLAWGHARVIDNLISAWREHGEPVDGVVSDKFGDESYIVNALASMKTVSLIQRPRGESNSAVAAASIIARDTFEERVGALEKSFGVSLPFGAGHQVKTATKRFIEVHGQDRLSHAAKTHFKTYRELS
jgi:ribonuclease HIII